MRGKLPLLFALCKDSGMFLQRRIRSTTKAQHKREREREVTNKGRRERHNAVVCNYIRGERKTEIKKVRERERNRKKGEFF